MKILFATSSKRSIKNPRHGSERQLMGQARALKKRGHEIEIDNINWNVPDLDGFDIVHMVNSNGPNGAHQALASLAHRCGVPVVGTPTYWDPDELAADMNSQHARQMIDIHTKTLIPWLANTDMLVPNSEVEANKLNEKLDPMRYEVIHNAVDREEINAVEENPHDPPEEWGDYVISVGRIEPRKNQWRLIYAMQGLWQEGIDANLVLIGQVNPSYWQKLGSEIKRHGEKIFIEDELQKPITVMNAIKHAKVLAMPSFIETPGLVALEAGALDTSLAITDRGATKEYFDDHAFYCNPKRVDSIADSIKSAWEADGCEYSEVIKRVYNYETAGKKLENIYEELIE